MFFFLKFDYTEGGCRISSQRSLTVWRSTWLLSDGSGRSRTVVKTRLSGRRWSRCSLPVLSGGHVAHGSVDGDGPGVEPPHHLAHLLSVVEGFAAPQPGNILLEQAPVWSRRLFTPPTQENQKEYLWGGFVFFWQGAPLYKSRKIWSGDRMLFPRSFSQLAFNHPSSLSLSLMHTLRQAPSSGPGSSSQSGSGAPPPDREIWAEIPGRTGRRRRSDPGPSGCSSCTRSAETPAKTNRKKAERLSVV